MQAVRRFPGPTGPFRVQHPTFYRAIVLAR